LRARPPQFWRRLAREYHIRVPHDTPFCRRGHGTPDRKAGGCRSDVRLRSAKRCRATRLRSAPMPRRGPELVVVSPLKNWTCVACGSEEGGWLTMDDRGPLCMSCADLEHLAFLPRGDAALTRRARTHSGLSAVVVRFSRARRRYERQGVLVEETAIDQAEAECLADADARARRRERERRAGEDVEFEHELAREITRLFPGCPPERAEWIARHTGERGSGRIGRTVGARAFDPAAVTLAVVAAVRHGDTEYDDLPMAGIDTAGARDGVRAAVDEVLEGWRAPLA